MHSSRGRTTCATFGELELWRRNVGGLESPLGLPGRDVAEKRPDGSRRELRRERQLLLLLEENISQIALELTEEEGTPVKRGEL